MQQTESFFSRQPASPGRLSWGSGLRFWTACLVVCTVLAAVLGGTATLAILAVFVRFVPDSARISTLGTLSGAGSILFLVLAGHCMDKAEEADRAIRFQCWRDEGFPLLSAGGSPTDAALGYKSL
jgi:hypothetical protein